MASESEKLYETVFCYFEGEFNAMREKLENGQLDDYKERVITSQKINEALALLAPYVRGEWRARQLVKDGELLKKELLSVRDIICNKPWIP
jgi:hypothetical protein